MVIEIERTRSLDTPFAPEQLYGAIYGGERNAHKFIITGTRDGAEITLSGTVTAKFLRADNVDVALTGTIEGGKACVTLGDECYAVPGRYKLAIFVTSGTETLCVYAAIGNSDSTAGSSTVDGGNIIPSVSDLIAQINAAVATIPASYSDLMAGIAGTYDASKTYAVGDYAWYNGVLYKCTTAITTAETWTAAHWSRAVLGDDVTGLKSAIDQNGAMLLRFEKGGIASNGTDTDYRGDARARSFKYISDFDIKISCVEPVSTHCFKVYYYNADGTFDKASDVLNTDYVIPSGSFFRILLMHDQSSSTAMALDAILAMFDYSFVNGSKAVKTELDDLTNNLTTYAPQNVAYNTGENYDVTNDTPATVSNGAYCFYTIPTGTNIKRIRVTGHMPGSNKYPLVAFYDANSTLLDQFGVKSTTYTDEVISVPTGTVSILFNTNVNYVNIFEIGVPFDGSSSNIGELRAKYDGCFNYIAYSEIDNSGQSINTKEHFEWCAKKPVFKTLKADMQLTSDGKIVLCHDNGFTLNSSGKIVAFNSSNCTLIKNLTYAECIALQHNGTDQHVCGLDTVLKVAKKYGKHVYLTLRNEENDDYDDILDEMFAQLKKYSMESETIINCYPRNDTKADAVRARSDTICIGYTCGTTASQYPTYIAKVQALGNAILTPYIFFSEVSSISDTLSSIQTYINNAISQGIRVYVAILENDDAADDLMDCGVVGGQIRVLPTDIPMT